jgi:large subunit ribosomal protein L25
MNLKIKATKRKELGRKVKKLREKDFLPGNIYGKKVKSESITLVLKEFKSIFKEAGETNIVNVVLDGKNRPTLIHNVQTDPITDIPLHVDFLQVDLKQKVTAQIPIEIVGESPAEKQGVGTVVQHADEIEVEALPTELPENFEIDASKLENVDDQVQVKDISIDKTKVEVKDDTDKVIVKVEPLRKEEEVAPPPEETEEGEEEGEGEEEEKEEGEGEEEEKEIGEETKESKA